jgi:PAS domain S-box-containing protein
MLRIPSTRSSIIWAPNAVLLAVLLVTRPRTWAIWLLAALPAHLVAQSRDGGFVLVLLYPFFANVAQVIVAAMGLRCFAAAPPRFNTLRDMTLFVLIAAITAPALVSFLAAWLFVSVGWETDIWLVSQGRFLNNVTTGLTVTPLILMAAESGLAGLRRRRVQRYGEFALLAGGLVATLYVTHIWTTPGAESIPVQLYAPLPFLLWAAVRFGPGGLCLLLLVVAAHSISEAISGRGPYVAQTPAENVLALQISLAVLATPLMFVAALIGERRKKGEALQESEERYRAVIEHQTELVCRFLPDATLTFVNLAYARYFGKSPDELIGQSFLSVIPEEERQAAMDHIQSLGKKPSPGSCERRVITAQDELRWLQWVDRPIFNDHGCVVEFQSVGRDITERKRAEEAVRTAQARFEGILAIAQDAIISVDSNQRIILFNQGAEKVFGYTQAEVIGRPLDLLLPQRFVDAHRKHIEDFGRSPDVARTMGQRREVSGRRKDGGEFPAEASISKLDLGGELVFTVILRDITERKRADSRLHTQYAITRILSESASIDEAAPRILQSICECLDWKVGEIWRVDGETKLSTFVKAWHLPSRDFAEFASASLRFTFPPGVGLPGRVCDGRKPVWIRNLAEDSNFLRVSLATKAGLRSAFGFPILLGEETLGAMVFFSREVREPDHDVLQMMVNIGSQIGQFIESRRAEEGLQRSEERFRQVLETAPDGMVLVRSDGIIALANEQMKKLFGYTSEELIGQGLEMLGLEGFLTEWAQHRPDEFGAFRVRPRGTDLELYGRRKDGGDVPVEIRLSPLQTPEGVLVCAAIRDVTERKRAEEALRESEARFRTMANTAPVMIWMSGTDKLCTFFNKGWLDFTGRSLEQELGLGWAEGVHGEDFDHCLEVYANSFDARREFTMEYRLRRRDGEYCWILNTGMPRFAPDGTFVGYLGSAIDINERKETEEALRKLSGRLISSQEEERRRLARELHDDLTQCLAALAIEAGKLEQQLESSQDPAAEPLRRIRKGIAELSADVHAIARQLHPAILDDLGLVKAIESECMIFSRREGIQVRFRARKVPAALPRDVALCLYRILQGGLWNIAKHAKTRKADVKLTGQDCSILLSIRDYGIGFDPAGGRRKGSLGLASMEERVRLIRGRLSIRSKPGEGTIIEVRAPVAGGDG